MLEKFNKIYEDVISEMSNIKRVKHWFDNFECACISAARNEIKFVTDGTSPEYPEGSILHYKENSKRNRELFAILLKKGYGVTKLHGVYHEIGQEDSTGEKSFLVVNRIGEDNKTDPDFYNTIFKLAEWFNQDSFLYKKAGDENAVLVGTNNSPVSEWNPGYGNQMDIGEFVSNPDIEGALSKVCDRAFKFDSNVNLENTHSMRFIQDIISEETWKNISVREKEGLSKLANRIKLK